MNAPLVSRNSLKLTITRPLAAIKSPQEETNLLTNVKMCPGNRKKKIIIEELNLPHTLCRSLHVGNSITLLILRSFLLVRSLLSSPSSHSLSLFLSSCSLLALSHRLILSRREQTERVTCKVIALQEQQCRTNCSSG